MLKVQQIFPRKKIHHKKPPKGYQKINTSTQENVAFSINISQRQNFETTFHLKGGGTDQLSQTLQWKNFNKLTRKLMLSIFWVDQIIPPRISEKSTFKASTCSIEFHPNFVHAFASDILFLDMVEILTSTL